MKKGFTLAEILITLTIVGVVAALTLPALMTNVSQAKIGPALLKFVNTFENGAKQCMLEQEQGSLSAVTEDGLVDNIRDENGNNKKDKDGNDLKTDPFSVSIISESALNALGHYIVWSKPDQKDWEAYNETLSYPTGASFNFNSDFMGGDKARVMKDGTLVVFSHNEAFHNPKKRPYTGTPYKHIMSSVYVDINGFSKPNVMGKGIFMFWLDSTGLLIPNGSNTYWSIASPDGSKHYKCDMSASPAYYLAARFCAGEIADNGWKANY